MDNEKQKEFETIIKAVYSLKDDVDTGEYHFDNRDNYENAVYAFVLGKIEMKTLTKKL